MIDPRLFFSQEVWPRLPDEQKAQMAARYPHVRLGAEDDFQPLELLPVMMLVGLTGTGKSTALQHLDALRQSGAVTYADDIPSRRELADWVLIPTAQAIANEPIRPVTERTARFHLTRRFAEEVDAGGSAAVYSWLYYRGSGPLLSEALRGPREIAYALTHYPNWRMIELWVDPVIRLQRLSQRHDSLDNVAIGDAAVELDFMSDEQRSAVEALLATGAISMESVVTAQTEAQSYGSHPYDRHNETEHYRCIVINDLPPEAVAQQIMQTLQEQA